MDVGKKARRSWFDVLRDAAMVGGSGEPVPIRRTVYGTSDEKAYQLSDGKLYRVRRAKNGS